MGRRHRPRTDSTRRQGTEAGQGGAGSSTRSNTNSSTHNNPTSSNRTREFGASLGDLQGREPLALGAEGDAAEAGRHATAEQGGVDLLLAFFFFHLITILC